MGSLKIASRAIIVKRRDLFMYIPVLVIVEVSQGCFFVVYIPQVRAFEIFFSVLLDLCQKKCAFVVMFKFRNSQCGSCSV
jgi:hypothetical protein